MKKLLRGQDILLLGLSGAVDIFNELKDPLGLVGSGYKQMYGWIPKRFRKTDYYQTVYRSLKTGYIEKVIKNGEPYLRLTNKGKQRVQRDFSFVRFQKQKWDRKWRVVIFDIEEKERGQRDILRDKLKELGFGMIQESVWISPYDVALDFREFIKSIGLTEQVYVMEVRDLLAGDQKNLVARIWPLQKINSSYLDLYQILTKFNDRGKLSMAKGEKELRALRARYLEILREDPCLPKELLPEDWMGEKVKKLLRS